MRGGSGGWRPPSPRGLGAVEQVARLKPERSDDLLELAAAEAVEKGASVTAFADREARVAIVVVGAPGDEPATVALDALEALEDLLEGHHEHSPRK